MFDKSKKEGIVIKYLFSVLLEYPKSLTFLAVCITPSHKNTHNECHARVKTVERQFKKVFIRPRSDCGVSIYSCKPVHVYFVNLKIVEQDQQSARLSCSVSVKS